MGKVVDGVYLELALESAGYKREVGQVTRLTREAEGVMNRLGIGAKGLGAALAGAGVVSALGAMGLAATRAAATLQTEMAKVRTAVNLSQAQMRQFSEGVLEVSRTMPVKSVEELGTALYDIVGAGIPASKAMDVLRESAKGAVGGVTSVAAAADALTTAMNVYRSAGLSAARANDIIFAGVALGKTTYDQLAASLGQVLPIAASYKVGLEEVVAVTAQLTANGLATSEAVTGIRSALTNIVAPTGNLAKMFPTLAKEFNATKLETVGLVGFLQDFIKATGGSKDALNALFSDIQGKTAVLSLLTDGGKGLSASLDQVRNSSGAAQRAYDEMAKTAENAAIIARNNFNASLTELGTIGLPLVTRGVKDLTAALQVMTRLMGGDQAGKFRDDLRDIGQQFWERTAQAQRGNEGGGWNLRTGFQTNSQAAQLQALKFARRITEDEERAGDMNVDQLRGALALLDQAARNAEKAIRPGSGFALTARQAVRQYGDAAAILTNALEKATEEAKAAAGTGPATPTGGGPTKNDPDADKAAKAAQRAAEAYADLQAKGKAAIESVAEADRPVSAFVRKIEDLERAFGKIDHTTPEMVAGFKAMREELGGALDRLRGQEARKFAEEMRELTASLTPTAVDDMAVALDNLVAQLRREHGAAAEPFIRQLVRVREAAMVATSAIEHARDALAAIDARRRNGGSASEALIGTDSVLAGLKARQAFTAEDAARKQLAEEIARVEERRVSLAREVASAAEDAEKSQEKATKHTVRWVSSVAQGARALVEAAQAAGALDGNMAAVANSAITAAESLSKVLASKGGDVGADLAFLASAVNIGKSLLGTSDADKARERALLENTRAIERLTQRAGDLAGLGLTGDALGGVRRGVAGILSAVPRGVNPAPGDTKIRNYTDYFDGNGIPWRDVEEVARALGIALDGTVQSFRDLADAIAAADWKAFTSTWAGVMAGLDALFDIDNVDSPLGRLTALAERMRGDLGSSAFRSFLTNPDGTPVDLSTMGGRQQARDAARSWYQQYADGSIDPALFGNLTPQEFGAALRAFINGLDDVAAAAEAAASVFDTLAGSLSTIGKEAKLYDRDAATTLRATVGAYGTAFGTYGVNLGGLLDGIDPGTEAGREAARERARRAYEDAAGMPPEVRDKLLDGLLAILDAVDTVADEAERVAAEAAATAERIRQERVDAVLGRADLDSRIYGDDDAAAARRRAGALASLSPALAGAIGGMDWTTTEGLETGLARLRDLYATINASPETVDRGALSIDQLTGAIAELVAGAMAGVGALQAAAEAAANIGSVVSAAEEDARRLGLDPNAPEAIRRTGAAFNDAGRTFGEGPNARRAVDTYGQIDHGDATQRSAMLTRLREAYAGTTDAERDYVGQYIDWLMKYEQAPGAAPAGGFDAAGPRGPGGLTAEHNGVTGEVSRISAADAGRLLDYAATQAEWLSRIAGIEGDILALLRSGDGLVGPPRFQEPRTVHVAGGMTVQNTFHQTFEYHAAPGTSPAAGGAAVAAQFLGGFNRELGATLGVDRTRDGDPRR